MPYPHTSIHATLHVAGEIEARFTEACDWLSLGGVSLFFNSLDDIDRTLAALCDLSLRMSAREIEASRKVA